MALRGNNYKIVQSGNIIEVYEYEKVPKKANNCINDEINEAKIGKPQNEINPNRIEEYIKNSQYVSRENIRRYALNNFNDNSLFITLTFEDNIQDHTYANNEFNKFKKRLSRQAIKLNIELEYIAVIEYQKRGAIHYHMLTNFPKELIIGNTDNKKNEYFQNRYWKNGFVKIMDINGIDNLGAYLVKYLIKDIDAPIQANKKRYLKSNNLKKSTIMKSYDLPIDYNNRELEEGEIEVSPIELVKELDNNNLVYTSSYENEFWGKIVYREYNLNRKWTDGGLNK